ncbi:diguanylate cyclase domain-containing protein [Mycolicibacterium sp.]|uniref:bifunctional diguanylate cyclase/phosphodiesterase n=1 Tax=Mycolicibacterium sp. TaxID=2320850 RepID=UPI003D0AE692
MTYLGGLLGFSAPRGPTPGRGRYVSCYPACSLSPLTCSTVIRRFRIPIDENPSALTEALQRCESEPIHIPGCIQPVGALMVVAGDTTQIQQVSANIGRFFGVPAAAALKQTLADLVGEDNTQRIRDVPVRGDLQPSLPAFFRFDTGQQMPFLAVQVHHVDGDWVIEMEPCDETEQQYYSQLFVSNRNSLWQSDTESDIGHYCDLIAQQVRELSGFDRVMIYRFDHEYNGEVIAESRSDRLPSLLGHHFPAADIPAQARRLYARNLIRILSDIDARPVALVPAVHPVSGKPLDMSYSVLRSMSPIHIEYLRNMGAHASLSISLMVGGKLWGLIACHHAEPRRVPFQIRDLAEFIGKTVSLKLTSLESLVRSNYFNEVQHTLVALSRNVRQSDNLAEALEQLGNDVLGLTRATGGIIGIGGSRYTFGEVPPADDVDSLVTWLAGHWDDDVYHTDCLESSYPPAAVFADCAAGLLAVRLDPNFNDFVLWLRQERVQAIAWAGNPEKSLVTGPEGPRIEPRRSFAKWVQEQHGHCLPWTSVETDAAHTLSLTFVEVLKRKAMASESRRTESRLKFLANHDPLTRLPNRLLLTEELEQALDNAAAHNDNLAVIFIDLDHFKDINDTLGHLVGDRYLQEVARRLELSVRRWDLVGRWGGDEFLIVIEGLRSRESLVHMISRLELRLTTPMLVDGHRLSPTASIGVALYPDDGLSAESLVHAADAAMYRAKKKGRNRFEFHTRA